MTSFLCVTVLTVLQYYSFEKRLLRYRLQITVFKNDFLAGCNPTEIAGVEFDDAITMADKKLGSTLASLATATVDGDGLAAGKN